MSVVCGRRRRVEMGVCSDEEERVPGERDERGGVWVDSAVSIAGWLVGLAVLDCRPQCGRIEH